MASTEGREEGKVEVDEDGNRIPAAVLRAKALSEKRHGGANLLSRWGDGDGSYWDRYLVDGAGVKHTPKVLPRLKGLRHRIGDGFMRPRTGFKRYRMPALSPEQVRVVDRSAKVGSWLSPDTAVSPTGRLLLDAPLQVRRRLDAVVQRTHETADASTRADELLLRHWDPPEVPHAQERTTKKSVLATQRRFSNVILHAPPRELLKAIEMEEKQREEKRKKGTASSSPSSSITSSLSDTEEGVVDHFPLPPGRKLPTEEGEGEGEDGLGNIAGVVDSDAIGMDDAAIRKGEDVGEMDDEGNLWTDTGVLASASSVGELLRSESFHDMEVPDDVGEDEFHMLDPHFEEARKRSRRKWNVFSEFRAISREAPSRRIVATPGTGRATTGDAHIMLGGAIVERGIQSGKLVPFEQLRPDRSGLRTASVAVSSEIPTIESSVGAAVRANYGRRTQTAPPDPPSPSSRSTPKAAAPAAAAALAGSSSSSSSSSSPPPTPKKITSLASVAGVLQLHSRWRNRRLISRHVRHRMIREAREVHTTSSSQISDATTRPTTTSTTPPHSSISASVLPSSASLLTKPSNDLMIPSPKGRFGRRRVSVSSPKWKTAPSVLFEAGAEAESARAYAEVCSELDISPDPLLARIEDILVPTDTLGKEIPLEVVDGGSGEEGVEKKDYGTELKIPNFGIGPMRGIALAAALAVAHPRLRTLNIAGNRLGKEAVNDLCITAAALPHLVRLDLSDNGPIFEDGVPWGFSDCLSVTQSLRVLHISRSGIGEASEKTFSALIQSLLDCHRLEVINMSHNDLLMPGVGASLAHLIEEHPFLRSLDLSWCSIPESETPAIGAAIGSSSSMEEFRAPWNAWAEAGGVAVGWVMQKCDTLRLLDLSYSRISPGAALVLARGLTLSTSMEELILDGSFLGDAGIRALVGAAVRKATPVTMSIRESNLEWIDHDLAKKYSGGADITGTYDLLLSDPVDNAICHDLLRAFAEADGATMNKFEIGPERGGGGRKITVGRRSLVDGKLMPESSVVEDRMTLVAIDEDAGEKLEIPEEGRCHCQITYHGAAPMSESVAPTSALNALTHLLTRSRMSESERVHLVRIAAQRLQFNAMQAAEVIAKVARDAEERFGVGVSVRAARIRALIAHAILPGVVGKDAATLLRDNLSEEERQAVESRLGQLARFVPTNPTAHYTIDLSSPNDRELLRRLLAINSEESEQGRASGGGDTSQLGTWDNFRNSTLNGEPLKLNSHYIIPRHEPKGILEFDYVSTTVATEEDEVLEDHHVATIIRGVSLLLGIDASPHLRRYYSRLSGWKDAIVRRRSTVAALKSVENPPDHIAAKARLSERKLKTMESQADLLATALASDGGKGHNTKWMWDVPKSTSRRNLLLRASSVPTLGTTTTTTIHEDGEGEGGGGGEGEGGGEGAAGGGGKKVPLKKMASALDVMMQSERFQPKMQRYQSPVELPSVDVSAGLVGGVGGIVRSRRASSIISDASEGITGDEFAGTEKATAADEKTQIAAMRRAGLSIPEAKSALRRSRTLRALKDVEEQYPTSMKSRFKFTSSMLARRAEIAREQVERRRKQEEVLKRKEEEANSGPSPPLSPPVDPHPSHPALPTSASISLPYPNEEGVKALKVGYKPGRPTRGHSSRQLLALARESSSRHLKKGEEASASAPIPEPSTEVKEEGGEDAEPEIDPKRLANAFVYLRRVTAELRIKTNHVLEILTVFPEAGFAREEAMVILFSRMKLVGDFWPKVLPLLTDEENRYRVCRRLGWLNVFNPQAPDTSYDLDLAIPDERRLAEVLVVLAIAEPGENFKDETFNDIVGWELPASWAVDVPRAGRLRCIYTSVGDGCLPVWEVRTKLEKRFLLGRGPKPE